MGHSIREAAHCSEYAREQHTGPVSRARHARFVLAATAAAGCDEPQATVSFTVQQTTLFSAVNPLLSVAAKINSPNNSAAVCLPPKPCLRYVSVEDWLTDLIVTGLQLSIQYTADLSVTPTSTKNFGPCQESLHYDFTYLDAGCSLLLCTPDVVDSHFFVLRQKSSRPRRVHLRGHPDHHLTLSTDYARSL